MGLLDNSSATVTVDCVVTDTGREFLARNDGRFEIVSFGVFDDEINYQLINFATGSLQQDNNVLNTPIFEASPNETFALKYPLVSISNPDLKYLPTLQPGVTSLTLGERTDSQTGKVISFTQTTQASQTVPSEIVDASFIVQMRDDLLYMQGQVPVNVTDDGLAQYVIPRTQLGSNQGSQVSFSVGVPSLPSDLWNTFGVGTVGSRTIVSRVRCIGALSGLNADIAVTINEEFTRS